MECHSYCIARQIDLQELERRFSQLPQMLVERHRQVLELCHTQDNAYYYLFNDGTLVCWNRKRYQLGVFFALIKPACDGWLEKPIIDSFHYKVATKTTIHPHRYYNVDVLHLESESDELKLSLSYGFSQSIKLRYYEFKIEKLVERYMPYLNLLSKQGKINLSRVSMRRIIANIASVKGEINVIGKFSYLPKFFWRHPSLEEYFILVKKYMDISDRTAALNHQLNTLNEIFFMFNSYLEGNHAHNLEIIIIVLIAVEILFSVLNLHL